MLITLAIIGIIAALTVPTLMTKVQDHGFRSAFLKNYAIIQNAYTKSISDGIPFWDSSNIDANDFVIGREYRLEPTLFNKYFKVQKGPYIGISGGGWETLRYFYGTNKPFKYLSGESMSTFMVNGSAITFQLVDGTILCFRSGGGYQFIVMIDVNGAKGPNTYGRDVYWLRADFDRTISLFKVNPFGAPSNYSGASDCTLKGQGKTCAYQIVKDRNFKIPKE